MRRAMVLILLCSACAGPGQADPTTTVTTAPATTSTTSTTATTAAPTTTSTTAEPFEELLVIYRDGQVEGERRLEVPLGSMVRLTVEADVEDEVHVHGYDLLEEVAPGEPAVFEFTADIPGIFEVELEGSHRLLMELAVGP